MKVKELITELQKLNPEADVITNCCQATSAHEDIVLVDEVGVAPDSGVYVGSGFVRSRTF